MNKPMIIWTVIHKPSRKLLHIRAALTTAEALDWWIAHSEEQAKAKAAFMGEQYAAAYFSSTDHNKTIEPKNVRLQS